MQAVDIARMITQRSRVGCGSQQGMSGSIRAEHDSDSSMTVATLYSQKLPATACSTQLVLFQPKRCDASRLHTRRVYRSPWSLTSQSRGCMQTSLHALQRAFERACIQFAKKQKVNRRDSMIAHVSKASHVLTELSKQPQKDFHGCFTFEINIRPEHSPVSRKRHDQTRSALEHSHTDGICSMECSVLVSQCALAVW